MARVKYPKQITLSTTHLESLIDVLKDAKKRSEDIYSFEFDYKNSHLGHVDLELISFRAYEDDDNYNYYRSYQLTGSGLLKYATLVRESKTLKTDNS